MWSLGAGKTQPATRRHKLKPMPTRRPAFPFFSLLAIFTLWNGNVARAAGIYTSLNLTLTQQKGNLSVSRGVNAAPMRNLMIKNEVATVTLSSASPDWALQLSPKLPINLTVQRNGGRAKLDLRSLNLKHLNLTQQGGNVDIWVDIWLSNKTLTLNIDQGQSNIHIHLPRNVGVWVKADQFSQGELILFGKTVATGTDSDDNYQSRNYASARAKVVVHLTMIQGRLSIDEQH